MFVKLGSHFMRILWADSDNTQVPTVVFKLAVAIMKLLFEKKNIVVIW